MLLGIDMPIDHMIVKGLHNQTLKMAKNCNFFKSSSWATEFITVFTLRLELKHKK